LSLNTIRSHLEHYQEEIISGEELY